MSERLLTVTADILGLTTTQSERLVRVARTLAMADAVLGSADKARRWIRKRSRALDGEAPLEMLDTDVGANAVFAELGRIDHGVFV